MTEPDEPADIYRRLHALSESRVRGVADPAMDRQLAQTRAALVKTLLRCIAAIERLPAAKDSEIATEQAVKRNGQLEYLRAVVVEMGGAPQ